MVLGMNDEQNKMMALMVFWTFICASIVGALMMYSTFKPASIEANNLLLGGCTDIIISSNGSSVQCARLACQNMTFSSLRFGLDYTGYSQEEAEASVNASNYCANNTKMEIVAIDNESSMLTYNCVFSYETCRVV